MRETGRCLEFPFSETGSFCWVKGINASFRLWSCRPTASEGWLMWFLPTLGPLRLACLPGLSCSVSPWYRHSHRQVCSPNSCLEEEELWMLNNRAVIGNWFVHLPTVWVRVSRWCLASYLPSAITSFFSLSLSLFSPTAPAAARKRCGGRCLLLPLRAVQLLDQGQAQPHPACALHEAPTQREPQEASALAERPARRGGRPQLYLHHPQMPHCRYRSEHDPGGFVCVWLLFTLSVCYTRDLSSISSAGSFTSISCQNLHSWWIHDWPFFLFTLSSS